MTELGILTGLTRGEATVTVADSATSLTGTAKVTVVGGVLKALEIAGAPLVRDKPSGTRVPPNVLPLGLSANFIATALYADAAGKVFLREDVTDHAVWSSSHPKVASVSTGGSTRGVVDALAVGATNIKAAFGGLDSKAFALTVAKVPPTSLVIVPSSLALPVGEMSHFLARATYAVATAGKTAGKPTAATFDVTAVVAWRSSDKTVASVSNAPGLSGQVRAIATGTATITASLVDDGASTHATVTVTPAAMSALAITPALRVLGIGERVQYRARAT
ncbi:MAG TPA: hypothetical protein VGY54_13185, partial [Polyangiaceae bacterium]|nr:hypothetical protein [Polyangiaceae bacterium]